MTSVFLRTTVAQVPSSLKLVDGEKSCKKRLSAQVVPQSASFTALLHKGAHCVSVGEAREAPQIPTSDVSANKRASTSKDGGEVTSLFPKDW